MRSIPRPDPVLSATDERNLFLEVVINDFPTGVLTEFSEHPELGLTTTPEELAASGLKLAEQARIGDNRIALQRLPGVSYRVAESEQRLYIIAPDETRIRRTLDARASRRNREHTGPQADYGAVLNYSLFGATGALSNRDFGRLDTFSGSFDLRAFGPLGTLSHSLVAGRTSYDWMDDIVRLRTAWTYSDPMHMLTYRAGDLVSGGLTWTRPVNLGGVQVQRNFGLRSDLVTKPLPSFAGSAAVPTTVEVYSQNTRVWSSKVAPGPFEVFNLPVIGTSGEARVVLLDSQGREIETVLPFYNADILLREGLFDFSIEAGFPRRSIGVLSDDYDDNAFAILSARYGLSNELTLEGHLEAGSQLGTTTAQEPRPALPSHCAGRTGRSTGASSGRSAITTMSPAYPHERRGTAATATSYRLPCPAPSISSRLASRCRSSARICAQHTLVWRATSRTTPKS
ncbi:MAG: fimbrial biogenesis outer membrane usher protein [Hyphomicrobium sp.]|nr:fimbrial biogenesis outer membrane usher protein [Hyphomicrobium sp.]